jgi:hypothetical protein
MFKALSTPLNSASLFATRTSFWQVQSLIPTARDFHSSVPLNTPPYTTYNHWKTSLGKKVSDDHWSGLDDTLANTVKLEKMVKEEYGASPVHPATRTYNCHAYVHAQSHAWFNYIDKFLKDDYYPYSPGYAPSDGLKNGDVCIYVKDNQITHSAFITNTNGTQIFSLRSKWGALPLVDHAPQSVPNEYGSIYAYLRKKGVLQLHEEKAIEETNIKKIQFHIEAMTKEERIQKLLLASNVESLDILIRNEFKEIPELYLHGKNSEKFLIDAIDRANVDEKIIPLLAAAKQISTPALLSSLARKVSIMPRGDYSLADQYLLSAFAHINALIKLQSNEWVSFHEKCIQDAAVLNNEPSSEPESNGPKLR